MADIYFLVLLDLLALEVGPLESCVIAKHFNRDFMLGVFGRYKGHTYAGDKDGVTLKLEGGKTVHFSLIGKRCRQYGYRPEAEGRAVDTACNVTTPGQAKAPPPPLTSTPPTALMATHRRCC